ncbi:hypothetical protein STEG23_024052, partial [Scotinomys teguina]
CDSENRYVGNPLRGTCYYSLLIDYQFTFSLLQEDDRHHTAINFIANPEQSNKNLDISINASNNFNLNITWSVGSTGGTISGEETPIVSKTNVKEYRDSFSYEKFNFRSNPNITFYVYVSNFSWPIKIQIAFSQHNTIMDLVQFFVTFFRCFSSFFFKCINHLEFQQLSSKLFKLLVVKSLAIEIFYQKTPLLCKPKWMLPSRPAKQE